MKRFIFFSLFGFFLIALIPYIIISTYRNEDKIKVYITDEDRVCEMDRLQYIKEVVSAEMPAEFHEEALKAQAVAAATYLKSGENKHPDEHKGAAVCTDYKHCKAWMSEKKRRELWEPEKRDEYWKKISECCEKVYGEYILYNNEPIRAVFHSTSSGITENAYNVWGNDVPYLVSVKSEGEELSPKYKSEKDVTTDEYKKAISEAVENTDWSKPLFSDIERSNAGGIINITVGGVKIKGTQLRTIFDLRSTNAEISEENGIVHFDVTGNGHGVGMSQYGANYLASTGSSYIDILKHYYTGVEIGRI